MKIYVDADACPVVSVTEALAKKHKVPLVLLCDTNHVLRSDYAQVCTIDAGADSVDFALVNRCQAGDIVVTQDYGVAAMALSKRAFPIHQSGSRYTEENIEGLLARRHITKQARRASAKNHLKGPHKRTAADDRRFADSLEALLEQLLSDHEAPEK